MTLTFGSLFAGIGGIDLGLERAGLECAWQVEIDEYCRRVLEQHWPKVRRFDDVREVGKHNLKPVDLIAGGFPCQPHSVAGKRRGAADDRNLWPEFSRIVRETRPRYVLAENVPGIVTTYLDTVLSDLEDRNYSCWTFNLPAGAFGAPHLRKRIFVVAHLAGSRLADGRQSRESTGEDEEVGKMAFAQCERRAGSWWQTPSPVQPMVHGLPGRLAEPAIRALGNAVVPQVAEWIGRRIMDADNGWD